MHEHACKSFAASQPQHAQNKIKSNSHLNGLQCTLNKYQHENKILSNKVTQLIQQNKRLRLGSSFNHQKDYIKYQKNYNKYKENYQSMFKNVNRSDIKTTINKLQQSTYNMNMYDRYSKQNEYQRKYRNNNQHNTQTLRKQVKQLVESSVIFNNKLDNQRKNSISLPKFNKIQNKNHTSNDQKQTQRYSYRNFNNNNKNRIKTQPNSNKSNRQQLIRQFAIELNKQKNVGINRQVYLQDQTIFIDSQDISIAQNKDNDKEKEKEKDKHKEKEKEKEKDKKMQKIDSNKNIQIDYQKLPIFIQASFGNLEQYEQQKQKKKVKKYTIEYLQKDLKQHKNISKSNFRLQKTQQQKKIQYKVQDLVSKGTIGSISNTGTLQLNIQQKQNTHVGSCKKTNSPYIKSDYKLTQPKTQLAKILHHDRKKQQNKCQLQQILHNKCQLQQILHNKCQLKEIFHKTQENVQNYGNKKTFINVVSKKPKLKIFLK